MKNSNQHSKQGKSKFAPRDRTNKFRRDERPRFDKRKDERAEKTHGKPRFDKPRGKPPFDNRKKELSSPAPILRENGSVLIWGLHAVRAAWLNPKRRCFRLWITENALAEFETSIKEAREDLLLKRPDPKRVDRQELDRITPPASVHQGIVLEMATLPEPTLHDIINVENPPDLLIMLDQVTDPHNVGAILRSAAAFGAGAVIMTERNAPTTTGVLAKSASGALEHVPQIHVVNLSRALDDLKDAGYWSIGLAEEGERDIGSLDLTGRTVIVMGAEGEGLRQLTRKKCDELTRLPTGGAIATLNVSNAAAVALYEVRRQKKSFT